jgi:hypothetical protein
LATLFIDDMRNNSGERNLPRTLPQIAPVAGQLEWPPGILPTEDILGDEEHAVKLGAHVEVDKVARLIRYACADYRVGEAQQLIVKLLRGGLVVDSILGWGLLKLPCRIREGVLKGGREVVEVVVGSKVERRERGAVTT